MSEPTDLSADEQSSAGQGDDPAGDPDAARPLNPDDPSDRLELASQAFAVGDYRRAMVLARGAVAQPHEGDLRPPASLAMGHSSIVAGIASTLLYLLAWLWAAG